jgi:biotin carboxyl carrier protein
MSVEWIAVLGAGPGGREVQVELIETAGGLQLRVAGARATTTVDAVEIAPGTWSILAAGRSWLVDLHREGERLWLEVDGAERVIELESARARRLRSALGRGGGKAASGEVIRAPIAGKVVKVLVASGDEVAPGAPVLVLEAMKMENELRAERGGKVLEVAAAVGDSVETNQKLVRLG